MQTSTVLREVLSAQSFLNHPVTCNLSTLAARSVQVGFLIEIFTQAANL
jgi:hypothetical protein